MPFGVCVMTVSGRQLYLCTRHANSKLARFDFLVAVKSQGLGTSALNAGVGFGDGHARVAAIDIMWTKFGGLVSFSVVWEELINLRIIDQPHSYPPLRSSRDEHTRHLRPRNVKENATLPYIHS